MGFEKRGYAGKTWCGNPLKETIYDLCKGAEKLFGAGEDKEMDGFGFWKQYPLSEVQNRLRMDSKNNDVFFE